MINTQELFWAISGPITALFFFSTVVIILRKKYHLKDLISAAFTLAKPSTRQEILKEDFNRHREELMGLAPEGDPPAATRAGRRCWPGRTSRPISEASTRSKGE